MLENSFLIDTRMKKFDTTVPATPLVGSLSKAQFCTRLGATRWLMCDLWPTPPILFVQGGWREL
jgi:hypothetical protein